MMRRQALGLASAALVVGLAMYFSGCGPATFNAPQLDLQVPLRADSLAAEVVRLLGRGEHPIPIATHHDWTIESGWMAIEGHTKGVLFWKMRWDARVRHHISIVPSFDDPSTESIIQVSSEMVAERGLEEWRSYRQRRAGHCPWIAPVTSSLPTRSLTCRDKCHEPDDTAALEVGCE